MIVDHLISNPSISKWMAKIYNKTLDVSRNFLSLLSYMNVECMIYKECIWNLTVWLVKKILKFVEICKSIVTYRPCQWLHMYTFFNFYSDQSGGSTFGFKVWGRPMLVPRPVSLVNWACPTRTKPHPLTIFNCHPALINSYEN